MKAVSLAVSVRRVACSARNCSHVARSCSLGAAAENLLERGGDERPPGVGGAADLLREVRREPARLGEGERAVGQRQGLLRHDALVAPVAFVGAGGVEDLQERHLLFVRVAEIQAPAVGGQALLVIEVGAAGREVELAGDEQDAVADDLGFHPPGVGTPEVDVVGVGLAVGLVVGGGSERMR